MKQVSVQTVSPVECGKILGIGRTNSYKLVRQGVIPALRIGRKLRIPRAAIERLLRHPEKLMLEIGKEQ